MKKYIVRVWEDRTEWTNEAGEFHREDGPAIEYADGDKQWWVNGKFHRLDGPAIEYTNGHKQWYVNGKRHRLDGPAIESSNGHKQWWVDDKKLTESEFNEKTKQLTYENKIVEIEGIKYKLTKV